MTRRWSSGRSWRLSRLRRPLAAIVLAILVAVVIEWSGSIADGRAALIYMGFDPERARLIAALSVEAIVVAVVAFASGLSLVPSAAGIGLFGILFAHSFIAETRSALASNGAAGRFDPIGWAITLGTLAGAAIVVAWASATLAVVLRAATVRALTDLRIFIRDRRPRRKLARPALLVAAIVALAIASPVFSDMVNYAPDVHMRVGGDQVVGLVNAVGNPPAPGASPAASAPVAPPGNVDQVVLPPPTSGGQPPSAYLSSATPWLAWRPRGSGTVTEATFPAPWTGGSHDTASIWIYTPPGYATSNRRYPVMYEVPWGPHGWDKIGMLNILDGLTDSGRIPGTIAVFVSETGGPYPDSECVDSADQREHIESYLTKTIVPYIDANYRTIASPAGRSLLGLSQGGYCVAMLALRNPSLFGTAIAFSGYYQAGIRSAQTVNAALPFDGNQAAMAAHSPDTLAGEVPSSIRGRLLIELEADPTNPFYGPQYHQFSAALEAAGIPVALFPTPLGHSWVAPRVYLPDVLTTLAAHEVAMGAFA
jgi:enterochelin esterase-like enzyme